EDPRLARSIERRFGDWGEAMREADVPYVRARQTWTRESVISALRERHDAGMAVHGNALVTEAPALLKAVIRHLGATRMILEVLGLPQRQPTNPHSPGQRRGSARGRPARHD